MTSKLRARLPAPLLSSWERLRASPLGYRLAKGAFWSVVGTFVARFLALVASFVTARVLGKTGFGEFAYIQTTVGMFSSFAGFGIGVTATKYVAQYRQQNPSKAGQVMALCSLFSSVTGVIAGVALLVLAPWVSAHFFKAPHDLSNVLRIGTPVLVMGAITNAQMGALSGLEAFRAIAWVNLWAGLAAFPLSVAGVLLWDLPGAVWGMVGASTVNVVLNSIVLRKQAAGLGISFTYRGCLRHWPVLWAYSLPALLASLLVTPVNWLSCILLGKQPNGVAELAVFNAANQWRASILFLPNTLAAIILPILASLAGEDQHRRHQKVLLYNIVFIGGFTLAVAMILSLAAPLIMSGYGPEFVAGSGTLVVLLFSAVLSATIGVIGQSLASAGRMWWAMLLNLFWALALLGSAWYLIRWGALGLAWANLLAYGLHLITVSAYTYWFIIKKSYVLERQGA